jgi:hypothetical protein
MVATCPCPPLPRSCPLPTPIYARAPTQRAQILGYYAKSGLFDGATGSDSLLLLLLLFLFLFI